jgi:hypothetical protein
MLQFACAPLLPHEWMTSLFCIRPVHASAPLPGVLQVNKAKSLAGATLAFAIVSCLGFIIPAYWFPGLRGILGIIGTSVILCCAGNSQGGHIACAVLCILAALFHAAGVGLYIWYYTEIVDAIAASEVSGVSAEITAAWVGIIIWPAVVLNCISLALELTQAIFCFTASSAIIAGALPTTSKGVVQA